MDDIEYLKSEVNRLKLELFSAQTRLENLMKVNDQLFESIKIAERETKQHRQLV